MANKNTMRKRKELAMAIGARRQARRAAEKMAAEAKAAAAKNQQ